MTDIVGDKPIYAVGLMSGTSMDGIDAAVVEIGGPAGAPEWAVRAFLTVPYTTEQRGAIERVIEDGSASRVCRLNVELGESFAQAALQVLERAGIAAADVAVIGCHGQTVRHEPPRQGAPGATLQLGCAATIAERTGIAVVSDFRSRDIAAGGHGAPLVPWSDRLLFAAPDHVRVLVNIGGMANVTRVPPRGSREAVTGFDTGPGNALIDAATAIATDGASSYDRDGRLAASGSVDQDLLADLLQDAYYDREPPKSTGREYFGRAYVERAAAARALSGSDLVATFTALTAKTIAHAIARWCDASAGTEVIATGGGAHNPVLMAWLARELEPIELAPAATLGIDPDAKEAVAFALLAWAHLRGLPGNEPAVTGASGPRVLGSYTPGRRTELP